MSEQKVPDSTIDYWADADTVGEIVDMARDLRDARAEIARLNTVQPRKRIRHKKRGGSYYIISDYALVQTDEPLGDYAQVAVYRGDDGKVWVRPIGEMNDGRFEPAPDVAREEDNFRAWDWDDDDCTLCDAFEIIAEKCANALEFAAAQGTIYGAMQSAASLVYERHVASRASLQLPEIESVDGRFSGQPCVVGRRIPVAHLIAMIADGSGPTEFAQDMDQDEQQIRRLLHGVADNFNALYAIAVRKDNPQDTCEHQWVDIRNNVVESGSWCSKCFAVSAENFVENPKPIKSFARSHQEMGHEAR